MTARVVHCHVTPPLSQTTSSTLSGMAVFDGVHYVLSSSIPAEQRKELSGLLDLNGATSAPPHTHLIVLAGLHTQHEHVESLHVVSEIWVQRSIVLGKLQL